MSELRTSRVKNQGSVDFDNITLDADGSTRFALSDGGGGTPVLFVNKDNNHVGINTVDPQQALDVAGDFRLSGNAEVGGTLDVTGNADLDGTLDVTGTVDIGGGNITLNANGNISASNKVEVDRGASTENSAYFETNLNGTRTGLWTGNGSLYLGGPTTPTAQIALFADGSARFGLTNIQLNANGSAEFAGDVEMASQNGDALAGLRNVLINGSMQIWQRGTTITNEGAGHTTCDMWKETGSTVGATVTQSRTAPAGLPFSAVLSDTCGSFQTGVELPEPGEENNGIFALGSTWTLSVWATKDLTSSTGVLRWRNRVGAGPAEVATDTLNWSEVPNTPQSNGFTRYQITFEITTNNPGIVGSQPVEVLTFALPSGTSLSGVSYAGAQLEPGSMATPNENRPIGLELKMCERYFQIISISQYKPITIRGSNSGFAGAQFFPLNTTMREQPTSTVATTEELVSFANLNSGSFTADPNVVSLSIAGSSDGSMYAINFADMGAISNNELQIVAVYDAALSFRVRAEL